MQSSPSEEFFLIWKPAHIDHSPLQLCEGDCDNDSQCEAGLKCFQRIGLSLVPGCNGNGDTSDDYCVSPTLTDYGHIDHSLLQLCEGNCDNDSQYEAGLIWFQRSSFKQVPGYNGNDETDGDYMCWTIYRSLSFNKP